MLKHSPRLRLAGTLVLLCCCWISAATTAQAGVPDTAAAPATFAGVSTDDAFAAAPAQQRTILTAQAAAGVGLVRQNFDWAAIEPRPGLFNFRYFDSFMLETARAGIEVLPILFGAPEWGTARPPGNSTHGTYPPRDLGEFADYAATVAARYGRGGTFWTAHPEVTPRPILNYQVWNEPNLSIYWLPKPSAKAYASLLSRTAAAIRSVDPAARIVLAGMPPASHLGAKLTTYLGQLYSAGAKGTFDVVSVNAYTTSSRGVLDALTGVRKVIKARKDPTAGLWVTEFGWGAGGPKGTYNMGAKRQASLVAATIRSLGQARRSLRLQGFVYYGWTDLPPYEGRTDFWGLHTGLHYLDGRPKPAAAAFTAAVQRLR